MANYDQKDSITSVFPKRLKGLRGVESQTKIAKKLNISQQAYSKYETGERLPAIDTLYSMAKLFDVPADYLIGLTNSSDNDKDKRIAADATGLSEMAIEKLCYLRNATTANGYIMKTTVIDIVNEFLESGWFFSAMMEAATLKVKTKEYENTIISACQQWLNDPSTIDVDYSKYLRELSDKVEYQQYRTNKDFSIYVEQECAACFQRVKSFLFSNEINMIGGMKNKEKEKQNKELEKIIKELKEANMLISENDNNIDAESADEEK